MNCCIEVVRGTNVQLKQCTRSMKLKRRKHWNNCVLDSITGTASGDFETH